MAQSVTSITTDEVTVTNADHIREFVLNADKDVFNALKTHFDTQKEKFSIEPMKITPSDDEKAQGAPEQFEVPIAFDQSNFFV